MKRMQAILVFAAIVLSSRGASAASCDDLAKLALPNTTITTASVVPAGTFKPQPQSGQPPAVSAATSAAFARVPEFCRVAATLAPTPDSDIRVEVWMPASAWNGKFQAVGNGNWAGVIAYTSLAQAVAAGYAAASTDGGHIGNTAAFVVGHPEKVIDMGHRAVHEMTVSAKALIDAFYGAPPKLSLWNGCSTGGRQGVAAALRYPQDFDAIAAGAPAVNWIHLHAGRMATNRAVNKTPAHVIPRAKYQLVHDAVLAACDADDGVPDGVLEHPMSCRFDPAVLQCQAGQPDHECLTPSQVESAKALYAPVLHPRTGEVVLPGLAPGAELGWASAAAAQPVGTSLEAYRYLVFQNAAWDPASFNPVVDIERMLQSDPDDVLGTWSTDLKAFFDRGGRLLLYHGWNDAQVTPLNTVDYFSKVVRRFGPEVVGKSIQLYMVPGMNHCAGGEGTDLFDKVAPLEQWVATGRAPASLPASRARDGAVDRTRPLCPFGQVARWDGNNSTNDASSFACVANVTR